MSDAASLHAVEGDTAFVRYAPHTGIDPKFIGPMPLRMAKGWTLFLNGFEFPHDPSGRKEQPLRPVGSRLSER